MKFMFSAFFDRGGMTYNFCLLDVYFQIVVVYPADDFRDKKGKFIF